MGGGGGDAAHKTGAKKLSDASPAPPLMDVSIYINMNIYMSTLFSHYYVLIDVFK